MSCQCEEARGSSADIATRGDLVAIRHPLGATSFLTALSLAGFNGAQEARAKTSQRARVYHKSSCGLSDFAVLIADL